MGGGKRERERSRSATLEKANFEFSLCAKESSIHQLPPLLFQSMDSKKADLDDDQPNSSATGREPRKSETLARGPDRWKSEDINVRHEREKTTEDSFIMNEQLLKRPSTHLFCEDHSMKRRSKVKALRCGKLFDGFKSWCKPDAGDAERECVMVIVRGNVIHKVPSTLHNKLARWLHRGVSSTNYTNGWDGG